MKMYTVDGCYIAMDERGRTVTMQDGVAARASWREPESFLRLAYSFQWQEGWPSGFPPYTRLAPLWARPDPMFACYLVEGWGAADGLLVATNGHGNYAPVRGECVGSASSSAWRDPRRFLRRNAEGGVFWTDECPNSEEEEKKYAELLADAGRKLWEVPDYG